MQLIINSIFMKHYFSLFILFTLLLSSGCKDVPSNGETPVEDNVSIEVSPFQFDVPQAGGTYSSSYLVSGTDDDSALQITTDVDWIVDMDYSDGKTLTFTVLPNRTYEVRTSEISLTYPEAESAIIYISQEADIQAPFALENIDIQADHFNVDIVPVLKDKDYICRIVTKEYMDVFGVTTDQNSLREYDQEYLTIMANSYGMSLAEYLSDFVMRGNQTAYLVDKLVPETEYLFFCYHINIQNANCESDIVYQWITTGNIAQTDVEFDFNYEMSGFNMQMEVSPVDYNGYYYYGYFNMDEFYSYYGADADLAEQVLKDWNESVDINRNLHHVSVSEILSRYCYTSVNEFSHSLAANTEYQFYAFAIDSQTAFASSPVIIETVQTGDANTSDLVIDLEVTNLGSRGATIHFTPSNDEDEYVGTYITKGEWDSFTGTNKEKMDQILNEYSLIAKTGYASYTLSKLQPSTDYVLFAFGYEGEAPSTDLFYIEFSTTEEVVGESVMDLEIGKYFDFDELIPYNSQFAPYAGYALFPLKVTVTPASEPYYYMLTTANIMDYYTEDEIRQMLLAGYRQYTLENDHVVSFDTEIMFLGFAMDKNGNIGPLCKETFVLTREGASSPEEYFNGDFAPKPAGFYIMSNLSR